MLRSEGLPDLEGGRRTARRLAINRMAVAPRRVRTATQ